MYYWVCDMFLTFKYMLTEILLICIIIFDRVLSGGGTFLRWKITIKFDKKYAQQLRCILFSYRRKHISHTKTLKSGIPMYDHTFTETTNSGLERVACAFKTNNKSTKTLKILALTVKSVQKSKHRVDYKVKRCPCDVELDYDKDMFSDLNKKLCDGFHETALRRCKMKIARPYYSFRLRPCQDNFRIHKTSCERCNCYNDLPCDAIDGYCPAGCPAGFRGYSCNNTCAKRTYGINCTGICHCSSNDICHHVTGRCPGRCGIGWYGKSCQKPCVPGTFGEGCHRKCFCRGNKTQLISVSGQKVLIYINDSSLTCDAATGRCLNGCPTGYTGINCLEKCPVGYFGDDCAKNCKCLSPLCDPITGVCKVKKCFSGHSGYNCQIACKSGHFGENCTRRCYCMDENPCNPLSGVCDQGCAVGYMGSHCESPCTAGLWGKGCLSKCFCAKGAACNHVTGRCTSGCDAGHFGISCARAQSKSETTNKIVLVIVFGILGLLFILLAVFYCRRRASMKVKTSEPQKPNFDYLDNENMALSDIGENAETEGCDYVSTPVSDCLVTTQSEKSVKQTTYPKPIQNKQRSSYSAVKQAYTPNDLVNVLVLVPYDTK